MKLTLALLALVAACPQWWDNPCIYSEHENYDCGNGRAWNSGNAGSMPLGGPFGYSMSSWWDGHGKPDCYDCGYYSQGIYAQSCAAACVYDDECEAYAITGASYVYGSVLGTCHLYDNAQCTRNYNSGSHMWVMGTRQQLQAGGSYNSFRNGNRNRGFDYQKWGRYLSNSEINNICSPASKGNMCPAGQEMRSGSCQNCNLHFYKSSPSDGSCNPCQDCAAGNFRSSGCSGPGATTPPVCTSHTGVCPSNQFQTQVATGMQDRSCSTCNTCQIGSAVLRACARADPWAVTTYTASSNGQAADNLVVFQHDSIVGKPIVVHDSTGAKAACGILSLDPWSTTDFATTSSGTASGQISAFQQADITGKTVVVHASNGAMAGCGVIGSDLTATITSFSGFSASGSFAMTQIDAFVSGTFSLNGLESNAGGSYHIHTGTSCSNVGGHLENGQVHSAQLSTYPGYSGPLSNTQGSFGFTQLNNMVRGQYSFSAPAGATGSFHLHTGTACNDANVGTHLVNNDNAIHVHNRRLVGADHPGGLPTSTAAATYTDGNTQCIECIPGQTFADTQDQAVCKSLTPPPVGKYVSTPGTIYMDNQFTDCSNKPSNAHYTSGGSAPYRNDCAFACNTGFDLTNNGRACAAAGSKLAFKGTATRMTFVSHADSTLSLTGGCMDLNFCDGASGKTMQQHLETVFAAFCPLKMTGVQVYDPNGAYVLDDGVCRYQCNNPDFSGGCAGATLYDNSNSN